MCQTVSVSASSQCSGISSPVSSPAPKSLPRWEPQSGSMASPTLVSHFFLILRASGFYFPPFNPAIYLKNECISQYLYIIEEIDTSSTISVLPRWQKFLPWFYCVVYIFLGISMYLPFSTLNAASHHESHCFSTACLLQAGCSKQMQVCVDSKSKQPPST